MSNTYYVSINNPESHDSNPGSKKNPYKSVAKALRSIKPGDTIELAPGVYQEPVNINKNNITIISSEEKNVVFTLPHGLLLDPSLWKKVRGHENVYEQTLSNEYIKKYCKREKNGQIIYENYSLDLFINDYCIEFIQVCGTGIHFNFGTGERTFAPITQNNLKENETNRWTISPKGCVQINTGGVDPSSMKVCLKDGKYHNITVSSDNCIISGITVEGGYSGFSISGSRNIIKDCVVKNSYYGARIHGRDHLSNIIRRCCFYSCKQGVYITDNMGGHIIEENFFIGTGQPSFHHRSPQNNINEPWGPGTALRFGNSHYVVFRYNVIADSTWAGWWPDVNCYGNSFYGNIITNVHDRGIYNEYPVNDSRIYYNAITDCDDGIIQRFSWRTMNLYNYISRSRNSGISIWGPHIDNGYRFDNVFAKNVIKDNKIGFVYNDNEGMSGNLPVAWPGESNLTATALSRIKSQIVDDNLYRIPENGLYASINGTKFAFKDDFTKITDYDKNSKIVPDPKMENFGLGVYTVNIPFSQNPQKPVECVGNPVRDLLHCDLLPVAAEDSPYFWQQGDAEDQRDGDFWKSTYGYIYEWPHFNRPVRRLLRTKPGFDPNTEAQNYSEKEILTDGPGLYMELTSHIPGKIPEKGSGFWSPSLPAVEGKNITVSFMFQSENLHPIDKNNGFTVFIRFSDLEGKLIGEKDIWTKTLKGNSKWKSCKNSVKVPREAFRFSVFIGMLPCGEGVIRVGNIYIASGENYQKEIFLLPDYENAELIPLADFYNHDLDKDTGGPENPYVIDKFVENYCGMGKVDLSGLKKGDFSVSGIPVKIESAITLSCHRRPPVSLPMSVKIPVNKKAKALVFTNAGSFMALAQENFRYVINYADGTKAEAVPVRDLSELIYRQPYFCRENAKWEGAVLFAHFKGNPCFAWINPRADVEIESFEFSTMDTGNAILLSAALLI